MLIVIICSLNRDAKPSFARYFSLIVLLTNRYFAVVNGGVTECQRVWPDLLIAIVALVVQTLDVTPLQAAPSMSSLICLINSVTPPPPLRNKNTFNRKDVFLSTVITHRFEVGYGI